MSDPQVINTLRTKADELQAHIVKLETALQRAHTDLSHIEAAITLFQAPAPGEAFPLHFNLGMLFRAKELGVMLSEALETGPKDTRELGAYVIEKKGLDVNDKALRRSIQFRVVNAMLQREKRGKAQRLMRRRGGGPLVWAGLSASKTA